MVFTFEDHHGKGADGDMGQTMSARQVLFRYWESGKLPIDPEAIARKAGVVVEDQDPGLPEAGLYRMARRNGVAHPVIEVNRHEPATRIRFAVAHELGHHFLMHGDRPRDTIEMFSANAVDVVEAEANAFAVRLLMPDTYVEALVVGQGITSLRELALRFGVSAVAMGVRLKTLGYI